MNGEEVQRDAREMVEYYKELADKYPILSIEDRLHEDDWDGWKMMTEELGDKIQLVGDDLFVTNIIKRLRCGIDLHVANAILVKVNQIGTLTEALDAVEMAQHADITQLFLTVRERRKILYCRFGSATGAGQIKTGAPCRSDRNAKYNQLLRIEDYLGLCQNTKKLLNYSISYDRI